MSLQTVCGLFDLTKSSGTVVFPHKSYLFLRMFAQASRIVHFIFKLSELAWDDSIVGELFPTPSITINAVTTPVKVNQNEPSFSLHCLEQAACAVFRP